MKTNDFKQKLNLLKDLGGHPRFYEYLLDMAKTHSAKNHDYSGVEDPLSNFNSCKKFGIKPWIGILVRMSDKWDRICNLATKEAKVKDEAIEDTLKDLAVYAILCLIVKQSENEKNNT